MRRPIIGGNWKMNGTMSSAERLAAEVRNSLGSTHGADIVLFPPAPLLGLVQRKMRDSSIHVGAQDVHPMVSGAYTGGTSAETVKSMGCGWTLVGHSERRNWFGDDDERVAAKLATALSEGLSPILCVGESLGERESQRTFEVLERQLDTALGPHQVSALGALVIAYEPVWAIGTGVSATTDQVQEAHRFIRAHLTGRFGQAFGEAIRIQYGGSVTPENASTLLGCPDVDGALVGGASLNARSFTRIVYAAAQRRPDLALWSGAR
jgi:triosephosphate isomerase